MTAPWPFPDMRNGTTLCHITDTHNGYRSYFTDSWFSRVSNDMVDLKVACAGYVHTGDMVEDYTVAGSDTAARAFWDAVGASGLPRADVPGNHDLATYTAQTQRDKDLWAQQVMGRQTARSLTKMGDLYVIGIPAQWTYPTAFTPQPLSADDLAWLDQQLAATGSTPCWLATHEPPPNTVGSSEGIQPIDQINTIIGSYPQGKVIGWLTGHWHRVVTDGKQVQTSTVNGRTIHVLTGPSGMGLRGDYSAGQQKWQGIPASMFVTYLGDAIDVRWRDHLRTRWVLGQGNGNVYHQTLAA